VLELLTGHDHGTGTALLPGSHWLLLEWGWLAALLVLALAYAEGLWWARDRSPWPRHRTVCWYLGLLAAAAAVAGPLARAAHHSFTAHMVGHLLLGMIAPLLLVMAAPLSLALRALPVGAARSLPALLASPPPRVLSHPVVAAALNGGGLWLLYTTPLFALMHDSPLVHGIVHVHLLAAGALMSASLVGVDPQPHRASMAVRSAVLIGFVAAHAILAKHLFAHPPPGVEAADARIGAQLMYYGGDAVDVLLIVLLFAGWYRATRPYRPRTPRPVAAGPAVR
jgi:putative membrane protein